MSNIRILPEQIANRIAAGEVVERPASVIKELVENSLDAGANRLEVEVEGNGTRLMRVIDNGKGMDEDDVLLCLERHGTSKIKSHDDLGEINTLGFRGEALPSIGSVSRLTITSRRAGADLGHQVILQYGKLLKAHQMGCGLGTVIEVRNLFGNTPARRKFLRTARTELGHIEEVVKNYCLGAVGVAFILRINGREILHIEPGQSRRQRLAQLMNYNCEFMEVGTQPGSRPPEQFVTGFLIPPDKAGGQARGLRSFVNGRLVRDRLMHHAVCEGLRGFLMKGHQPAGCIELVLPATAVDVNVHPAKHEVRFHRGREIHQLISTAVATTMGEWQQKLQTTIFGPGTVREDRPVPMDPPPPMTASFPPPPEPPTQAVLPSPAPPHAPTTREPEPAISFASATPLHETPDFLQVIGQYKNLYLFCQSGDDLLVIDQHAAHERLLYERLKKQFLNGSIVAQTLLFPATVELSVAQAQLVEQEEERIKQLGFHIREFGGRSYIIAAVPALGGHCDPAELFFDCLGQLGDDTIKGQQTDRLDGILGSLACRAAIKAGERLDEREIAALLEQMGRADLFSHCPHGRPVVKHFSETEVKKWFHRT